MKKIKRGEIYIVNLNPSIGSEQGGIRPVLIIQNNVGNKYSPVTIVAPITSRPTKAQLPTHHWLKNDYGLSKKSMVELEQIRVIDKSRLSTFIGELSKQEMLEIDKKLKISLGL